MVLFLSHALPTESLPRQAAPLAGREHVAQVSSAKQHVLVALKNGLASGLASACSKSILHPFDAVKTLQQNNEGDLGMGEAAVQLMRRGGALALYTGLPVSIIGSVPAVAVTTVRISSKRPTSL